MREASRPRTGDVGTAASAVGKAVADVVGEAVSVAAEADAIPTGVADGWLDDAAGLHAASRRATSKPISRGSPGVRVLGVLGGVDRSCPVGPISV
jgi:hypothetical protein